MKIICLVKYVPDTDRYIYDYELDRINREKSKLILNPDDKNALSFSLDYKKTHPDTVIEVVTMGPSKLAEPLKELARLGADQVTLISDKCYAGSDSLATSIVLSKYLETVSYDLLLTGTHTLDGGTGHVGPQVADLLQLNQYANVVAIDEIGDGVVFIKVKQDEQRLHVKMGLPCLLSVTQEMGLKLPFVKYDDRDKNVDDVFTIVTNETLNLKKETVGIHGSPTKVKRSEVIKRKKVQQKVVNADDEGVDVVIAFLKEKGYL